MRILMPVLHYWPVIGGLEIWTKKIAEGLSDGNEIFVVTGKVKGQAKKEIKKGVNIFRTSLFSLRDLSFSSSFYILSALPFIFFKSLFLIKKKKIALLHCQGFLGAFLGYLFLKIMKIPYVVTVQRLEKKGFLKKLVYINARVCIAASPAIKNYFEEIGVKQIAIIPNGIDLKRFEGPSRQNSRQKLELKNEFVVMTVGRLEKRKGIEYLIEAASLLNSKFKIQNSKFLIIGDGEQRKNLEKLVKLLKLEEKVRFLGSLPNEQIPEHLAAADCFVLPSLEEGFGIAILEAMAAQVPVIGTKVGGILDIIEDKKTGILVEPKNPQEIAKAVDQIYSQPQLRQGLIQNAKSNLEKYDWGKIIEKVEQIYKEILNL